MSTSFWPKTSYSVFVLTDFDFAELSWLGPDLYAYSRKSFLMVASFNAGSNVLPFSVCLWGCLVELCAFGQQNILELPSSEIYLSRRLVRFINDVYTVLLKRSSSSPFIYHLILLCSRVLPLQTPACMNGFRACAWSQGSRRPWANKPYVDAVECWRYCTVLVSMVRPIEVRIMYCVFAWLCPSASKAMLKQIHLTQIHHGYVFVSWWWFVQDVNIWPVAITSTE
jgi:hypothetical protein